MALVAANVRRVRTSFGLTLAELAHRAEISRSTLYDIETGVTGEPNFSTLIAIAQAVLIPLEELFRPAKEVGSAVGRERAA